MNREQKGKHETRKEERQKENFQPQAVSFCSLSVHFFTHSFIFARSWSFDNENVLIISQDTLPLLSPFINITDQVRVACLAYCPLCLSCSSLGRRHRLIVKEKSRNYVFVLSAHFNRLLIKKTR